MQQHTGQHVLSAAFDRLFGVRTVELSPRRGGVDDRSRARDVAGRDRAPRKPRPNRIVWEDRPVAIRFATAEEAARLPLRKEPARGGHAAADRRRGLRPVGVRRHPRRAHRRDRRHRGRVVGAVQGRAARLEFLCGGRALGGYRVAARRGRRRRAAAVGPAGGTAAADRTACRPRRRHSSGRSSALQTDLARYRAEELAAAAEEVPRRVGGISGRLERRRAWWRWRWTPMHPASRRWPARSSRGRATWWSLVSASGPPVVAAIARSADVTLQAQTLLAALQERSEARRRKGRFCAGWRHERVGGGASWRPRQPQFELSNSIYRRLPPLQFQSCRIGLQDRPGPSCMLLPSSRRVMDLTVRFRSVNLNHSPLDLPHP